MRLYLKCTNILYKILYNNDKKGTTIKKLSFIFIFFFPIFGFASWVILNDDGSTDIYVTPKTDSYDASKRIRETQQKKQKVKNKHTKTMYLTFDDGPLLGTKNIIGVLRETHVKATMFMIGKHVNHNKRRKKTFQMAINEPLIQVGNHSYSHANGKYKAFYSNTPKLITDMQKMDDIIFNNNPNYFQACCRLAGRNVWRLPTIKRDDAGIPKRYKESDTYDALSEAGFTIYGWDYHWDYNPKSGKTYLDPITVVEKIEHIYKKNRTRTKGKFVLLMHDFSFRNKFNGKENLRTLIEELKFNGWKFEKLETYL